jgi:hypothetical protein
VIVGECRLEELWNVGNVECWPGAAALIQKCP